jgi:hypothetical protein
MPGFAGISIASSPIIPNLLTGAKNIRKMVEIPKSRDPVTFERLKVRKDAIFTSN